MAEFGKAPHRAGMAINESYFLVGGMSVLTSGKDAPGGRPQFGLIECPEYALYNTLDLWIYAAEGVSRFFPDLAAGVADAYVFHLGASNPVLRRHRWDGSLFPVNRDGVVPHDLGGPGEDPFVIPHSYTYRDPTIWKDLNCYVTLCVFREGQAKGADWRRDRFPAVRAAIEHLQQFDRDGDNIIENEGIPDQTFDNIPMSGPSSYCGGLWIAALLAASVLAREAGEAALPLTGRHGRIVARKRSTILSSMVRGTGSTQADHFPGACFIEQLMGPFLARRLGLGEILPDSAARTALRNIFENNFLDAGGGRGRSDHLPHPSFRDEIAAASGRHQLPDQ